MYNENEKRRLRADETWNLEPEPLDKQNYPMASRIIKDALIAGKIKEEKTENQSRNNKGYVPFWA